ncbi:Entericidin EcnAB [Maritimibacter sp. 55A14]|uniref:entericidin A/B family lipoprotein n=1 Tax=Maritimibacter sp. 55A14 TaxID=2174844 RepID=UPI000D6067EE|nr:entericidin A/B family lipoprotein [Maritimibacter sp. 55A14]PWE28415.1 Entericidin EcnAB [Maritimibacter sp. 55A14]
MKTPSLTSYLLIAVALAASLSLLACNTMAGIGEDVSSGADAVTDSAEKNKNY